MGDVRLRPPGWKHEAWPLAGRRVVIAGGTTGIGRATAVLLAGQGADLLVFGTDPTHLADALADVRSTAAASGAAGAVHGLLADVGHAADVRRVFEEADRLLGGVDVHIHCAALAARGIDTMDLEQIERVLRVNIQGYIFCAQQALPRLKQRGGHLVCLGSMSAETGDPGADVYVASKGAIRAFCYSLRQRVSVDQVRVTLIEPGAVGSDMPDSTPAEQRDLIAQQEIMPAEYVAESVLYAITQPAGCDIVSLQIKPQGQAI